MLAVSGDVMGVHRGAYAADGQSQEIFAPGKPDGSKTKVGPVCQACNNGWMSRLEGRVKPLLIAMGRGNPVWLEPADQAVLSLWVAKTCAVVAQSHVALKEKVPLCHRQAIMNGEPIQTLGVALGRLSDTSSHCVTISAESPGYELDPQRGTTRAIQPYGAAFALGRIACMSWWVDGLDLELSDLGHKHWLTIRPPSPIRVRWKPSMQTAGRWGGALFEINEAWMGAEPKKWWRSSRG